MSVRVSPISPSVLSRFASSQFLFLRLAPLSAAGRVARHQQGARACFEAFSVGASPV